MLPLTAMCDECDRFEWDLDDDGAFEANGPTVSLSAQSIDGPSSRVVRLRACQGTGPEACATRVATIDIFNVAPAITTAPPTTIVVGTSFAYAANAVDPGGASESLAWSLAASPTGMTVDQSTGAVAWGAAMAVAGRHAVVLVVRDKDGGRTVQRFKIVVIDAAANGPYNLLEGQVATLTGTCRACASAGWDLDGDGTFETSSAIVQFVAGDGPSTPTVRFRACSGSFCAVDTPAVTVTNVAPVITSTPATAAVVNVPYQYTATATDAAGLADQIGWRLVTAPTGMTIDAAGVVSWTPTTPGAYPVAIEVFDEDGGASQQVFAIDIPITVDAGGPYSVQEGLTAPVTATCDGCDRFDWDLDLDAVYEQSGATVTFTAGDGPATRVIRVRACAGAGTANCAISLSTVDIINEAPMFTSSPAMGATAGRRYDYAATATDPAGADDVLTWSLATGPAGMAVNAATGELYWPNATAGSHPIELRVADEDGGVRSQSWTLAVGGADAGGPYVLSEGQTVQLTGACEVCNQFEWDLDGNGSFEAPGQTVSFLTGDGPRTPLIRLRACALGNCSIDSPLVEVQNVAPSFTTSPNTGAVIGVEYTYPAAASDPAGGFDLLSWRMTRSPAGMTMSNGFVRWPAGSVALGRHEVELEVSDDDGGVGRQVWSINVVAAEAGGPYTVAEGGVTLLSGTCTACVRFEWDLDGDTMFESVGASVPFVASTDGPGQRTVRMRACGSVDNSNCVEDAATVDVTNSSPAITSVPPSLAAVGVSFSYAAIASDPGRDPLTWSLTAGPVGMTISSTSGAVRWPSPVAGAAAVTLSVADGDGGAAQQNFTLEVFGVNAGGPYSGDEGGEITLGATCAGCSRFEWDLDGDGNTDTFGASPVFASGDGPRMATATVRGCRAGLCSSDTASIAVSNVAPVITSTAVTSAVLGRPYVYAARGFDPADDLIWSLGPAPTAMAVDANGRVTWTPTSTGAFAVQLVAADGDGASAVQSFTIQTASTSAGGPYAAIEGEPIVLTAQCATCVRFDWDLDGDGSFEASGSTVAYAAIDGATTASVAVRACQTLDTSDCSTTSTQVDIANAPPVITSTAALTASLGQPYTYQIVASDPAGAADPLVYGLLVSPTGMSVDANGLVTWTPADGGALRAVFTVSDGDGGVSRQAVTIAVAPAVDIGGPYRVNEGAQATLTASCNGCTRFDWDLDGDGAFDDAAGMTAVFAGIDGPSAPTVQVRGCDGLGTSLCTVTATVVTVDNVAPTIASVPAATGAIGTMYAYAPRALDPAGAADPLTWSLASGPSSAVVDPVSGLLTFTPTLGGTASFVLEVSDSDGGVTQQSFGVDMGVGLVAGPYVVDEFSTANLTAVCSGCDRIDWDLDGNGNFERLGATITLNAGDGPFRTLLRVRACRGVGSSNCVQVTAEYSITNVAPTVTSAPPTVATPGQTYTYAPTATDPAGLNDTLRWTLARGPVGMFTNSLTGAITWSGGAVVPGRHPVDLRVRDEDGGETSHNWTIAVLQADPGGPYVVDEGDTVLLTGACTACSRFDWDLDADGQFETSGSTVTFARGEDGPASFPIAMRACDGVDCVTGVTTVSVSNVAPVITSSPPTMTQLFSNYRYTATGTDAAGLNDTLTWSLVDPPTGMTVTSATGVITWTATVTGTRRVTLRLSDEDGGARVQAYDLVVPVGVDAGRLYDVVEGSQVQLTAACPICTVFDWDLDADGTFETSGQSVAFVGVDGPSRDVVTVRACEGPGLTNCDTDAATVRVANLPPTITSAPLTSVLRGSTYRYEATATDAGAASDPLEWSLREGPVGLSVTPSGVVSWLAPDVVAGDHLVRIVVSDGDFAETEQVYTIGVVDGGTTGPYSAPEGTTVTVASTCGGCTSFAWDLDDDGTFVPGARTATVAADDGDAVKLVHVRGCGGAGADVCSVATASIAINNVAPFITSLPPSSVRLGSRLSYRPVANEPAGALDTLIWSLASGPTGMTVDSQTGEVSWMPTRGGIEQVDLRVADEDGGSSIQTFTVVVPVTVQGQGPYVIDEGSAITLAATCSGCDRFDWDFDGNGAFDASGASVRFDARDGRATPNVTVRACLGAGATNCATAPVSLTIRNVDPEITSRPVRASAIGATYVYQPTAVDAAGAADPLDWSLATMPSGMTINPTSGVISWSATGGVHPVSLVVEDGDGGIARQTWTISVVGADAGGPYRAPEGGTVQLSGQCDGCVTFSWDYDGDGQYDDATGAQPTFDASQIDGSVQRSVVLEACDGRGACAISAATIDIENVAPRITTAAVTKADLARPYVYAAAAADPAGLSADPVRWRLLDGPPTMVVGPSNGVVSWAPVAGRYAVTLQATDDDGGATTQSWSIDVVGADAGGPYVVGEGSVLTLRGRCQGCARFEWDLDGDGAFEIAGGDVPFSAVGLDGATSRVARLNACDADGFCASDTAAIEVANVAPVIDTRPPTTADVGAGYRYLARATDPAGVADTISWSVVVGPAGLTMSSSGAVSWTAVSGQHTVTIAATDDDGGVSRQTWTISVGGTLLNVDAGGPYTVAEGGSLALAGRCPQCATFAWDFDRDGEFDDASGARPAFNAASLDGPMVMTVSMQGCMGSSCAVSTTSLDVSNVAPTFTSVPLTGPNAQGAYRYLAQVSDPSATDAPSFSVVSGPVGLAIDRSSGLVSWVPSPGSHPVTIIADDGDGGRTSQSWTINVAPEITFSSVQPRRQPERADYRFRAATRLDWTITLLGRENGACTSEILARRELSGVDEINGTWPGLSPGAEYCYRALADAAGSIAVAEGSFEIERQPQLTAMRAIASGVGLVASATVSGASVVSGEVQIVNGSCAGRPAGLRFDGDDVVSILGTVAPRDAFTIEAWIDLSGDRQTRRIVTAGGGAIVLELVDGALRLSVATNIFQRVLSGIRVPADGYTHIAATFDADSTVKVYIGGFTRGQAAASGGRMTAQDVGYAIGDAAGRGFVGDLAAMAVYDRALTLADVRDHAARAPGDIPQIAGQVALWRFDEPDGVQSIYDSAASHGGVLGRDIGVESIEPVRLPGLSSSSMATTRVTGAGTSLTAPLRNLAGGPAYCARIRAVADGIALATPLQTIVRAVDTTPPVVRPAQSVVIAECIVDGGAVLTLGLPSVSDDRDPSPFFEPLVGGVPIFFPFEFPLGETVVQWRATDRSGNVGVGLQVVRVTDSIDPEAEGGDELVIEATAASTSVDPQPSFAADSCSAIDVSHDGPTTYPLGATVVRFSIDDSTGNRTRVSRVVRVVDTTAPTFDPAMTTLTLGHDGTACFEFDPIPPRAVDLAYDSSRLQVVGQRLSGPGNPTCWDFGVHELAWTATDPSGNTVTTIQIVNVVLPTVTVTSMGIQVLGSNALTGRYYQTPVTVSFRVEGGRLPHRVDVFPTPDSVTIAGGVHRAVYSRPGDYSAILVAARDDSGRGANFGSRMLLGFGIDKVAPTIETDIADQTGVILGDESTYPTFFVGESIALDRFLMTDSRLGQASLVSALQFDGDDIVTIPRPASGFFGTATTDAISVAAWVWVERSQAATIVSKAFGDGTNAVWSGLDDQGRARAAVRVDGRSIDLVGPRLSARRWHHVVLTVRDGVARLWVDARPAAMKRSSGHVDLGTGGISLGASQVAGGFEGQLADVSLWRVELDEDFIKARYRGGVGLRASATMDTIALYGFGGDEQPVLDGSGRGHHGVLGDLGAIDSRDPERVDLADTIDPGASGLTTVRITLVEPTGPSSIDLVDTSSLAFGTPLRVGFRFAGGRSCNAFAGRVCQNGETELEVENISGWDNNRLRAYQLRLRAIDAAGNTTTATVAFRISGYRSETLASRDAIDQLRDSPLNFGAENELSTARSGLDVANAYVSAQPRHYEGSYLRVDQSVLDLLDAGTVGVPVGRMPEHLSRSLTADVRARIEDLNVNLDASEQIIYRRAAAFLLDARFAVARGDWPLASALAREAYDAIVLLHPEFDTVRIRYATVRQLWQIALFELGRGATSLDAVRADGLRLVSLGQMMAASRDLLRNVIFRELQAVRAQPRTPRGRQFDIAMDVLDKTSSILPDENLDLIAITSGMVSDACFDRIAVINATDDEFTRCSVRLNDFALALERMDGSLVNSHRWKAAAAVAMLYFYEYNLIAHPQSLVWITSNTLPPATQLVLQDAVAPSVPGAASVSQVDLPDGLLARAFDVHEQATARLFSGDIEGAFAMLLDARCVLLSLFNRYYSTLQTAPNHADPKELPINPVSLACGGG